MVIANETVAANQTISNLVTDATVTLNAGVTLKLTNGGVILREVNAAGWTGAGAITSGRPDGMLALTLSNRFAGSNGLGGDNASAFTVGNIVDNTLSVAPFAFRPVALVVNGFGNSNNAGSQTFTGGTILNGGRLEPTNPNPFGLGNVTVREGGSALVSGNYGMFNNFSLKGIGIDEGALAAGAIRLGGAGAATISGNVSLDSAVTRIHGQNTGTILGNVTGSNTFQRTGNGTIIVRNSPTYTGPTQLGTDGAALSSWNGWVASPPPGW